mmetsp:Transcript_26711/g.50832  ORF Transcript_26711/g.50832 Transcript_26711/m.50832 type:complete len:724 (+) Transcript_26711:315-2486(+)
MASSSQPTLEMSVTLSDLHGSHSHISDSEAPEHDFELNNVIVLAAIAVCGMGALCWVVLQAFIYSWQEVVLWVVPFAYFVCISVGVLCDLARGFFKLQLLDPLTVEDPALSANRVDEVAQYRQALRNAQQLVADNFFEQNDEEILAAVNFLDEAYGPDHDLDIYNAITRSPMGSRTKRLKLHGLATGHVIGVLLLPALVSIIYGGFAPSGGVVLWSFVGPFSSLYFNQPGSIVPVRWFSVYVAVVVLAMLTDLLVELKVLMHTSMPERPESQPLLCEVVEGPVEASVRFGVHVLAVTSLTFTFLFRIRREAQVNWEVNKDLLCSLLPKPVVNEILWHNRKHDTGRDAMGSLEKFMSLRTAVPRPRAPRRRKNSLLRTSLTSKAGVKARHHKAVTVIFIGLHGVVDLASCTQPVKLMAFIDSIFILYDRLAEYYGVMKMRTICDGYMAATGLMQEFGSRVDSEFHSTRALLFAISVLDRIDSQGFVTPLGQHMQVRIGMHSGSMYTGVVGAIQPQFDAFGDLPNTAARMKSHALPNTANLSQQTRDLVNRDIPGFFPFTHRLSISVKGKGQLDMYHLASKDVGERQLQWVHVTIRNLMNNLRSLNRISRDGTDNDLVKRATSAPPTMQADMFRKQASLNQARHRMVNIADMPAYALRQASINSGSSINNEALLRTASIDRYTADREDVQSIPIDTTHVSINLNPSAARMSWPMSELRGDPSIKR